MKNSSNLYWTMVYTAGRGVNYKSEGQIMKAFVGAAKDLGCSPIGKG